MRGYLGMSGKNESIRHRKKRNACAVKIVKKKGSLNFLEIGNGAIKEAILLRFEILYCRRIEIFLAFEWEKCVRPSTCARV